MSSNDDEDIEKRIAYLKQQRDRMLELKRKEREKTLDEYTKTQSKQRPTSARVARQAIGENAANKSDIATPPTTAAPSAEELKRIAMRKALADKLKKEVVYK